MPGNCLDVHELAYVHGSIVLRDQFYENYLLRGLIARETLDT